VRCLKTLVDDIAGTVNKTAKDAFAKGVRIPRNDHGDIPTQILITRQTETMDPILEDERGVAEIYKIYAARYFLPIASTLALHPSSKLWDSILDWTQQANQGGYAIADGILTFSDLYKEHSAMIYPEMLPY